MMKQMTRILWLPITSAEFHFAQMVLMIRMSLI